MHEAKAPLRIARLCGTIVAFRETMAEVISTSLRHFRSSPSASASAPMNFKKRSQLEAPLTDTVPKTTVFCSESGMNVVQRRRDLSMPAFSGVTSVSSTMRPGDAKSYFRIMLTILFSDGCTTAAHAARSCRLVRDMFSNEYTRTRLSSPSENAT